MIKKDDKAVMNMIHLTRVIIPKVEGRPGIDIEMPHEFHQVFTIGSYIGGGKSRLLQFIYSVLRKQEDKTFIRNYLDLSDNQSDDDVLATFTLYARKSNKKYTLTLDSSMNIECELELPLDVYILMHQCEHLYIQKDSNVVFYEDLYPEDAHMSIGQKKLNSLMSWIEKKESSIILLDNPDVFLHPDDVYNVSRGLGDYFNEYICATHSYEFCQAWTPHQVIIIDYEMPKGGGGYEGNDWYRRPEQYGT